MYPRIMMWMNYRRNHVGQGTVSVPSPFDGDKTVPYWYDKIASSAHHLSLIGVTDILFPNPIMGESGEFPTGDGYNPFDDYDIGSKGNKTRFGDAERFRRAVAICHANGINVHLDHVMHQRMGGGGSIYRYRASDGTKNGRFPKDPPCFRGAPPRVPEDPVPSPPDDFAFGDELCPVNAQPKNYVWDGLIDAGDWLFRTSGADGARLDDMKGMNVGFMKAWMTSKAMHDKFFFGEYASGNRDDLNWWAAQVNERASVIDFDFHYNMAQQMCMNPDNFYMGNLAGRGMIANNPMKAIPFVESMDSDTNGFATIIFNKILAYALLMASEGLPLLYIRDYLSEPDCYGLHAGIDNLCWIHQNLAHGWTTPRHGSKHVYVFERSGPPGLIMALNNDVWNPNWQTVTVQTDWSPGTVIHDYTGKNSQDCRVDDTGKITFGIPPGANGTGYGAWAPAGLNNKTARPPKRSTTQYFDGADDLDLKPLSFNPLSFVPQLVARIWCDKSSKINIEVQDHLGRPPTFLINAQVKTAAGLVLSDTTASNLNVDTFTHDAGWYEIYLTPRQSFSATSFPFRLKVNYTATEQLASAQF